MQSNHLQLYKLTAEREGKSEQIYKDIGNTVFQELNGMLRRPKSLIIKLKGVGHWFLRKSRMEIVLEHYPIEGNKKPDELSPQASIFKYENKEEIQNIFKERLKDYEVFLKIKKEIRLKRNETQRPIIPPEKGEY